MKSRRQEIQVFSVSFLDVISCALGGTLMLLLVVSNREENRLNELNVVFVMDATASMEDELDDVKDSTKSAVNVLSKLSSTLRVGFVAYWDSGMAEVTRVFPLTTMDDTGVGEIVAFIDLLEANSKGNEDFPEAVERGLQAAVDARWPSSGKRYIVVIGDAPAHQQDESTAFRIARRFHGGDDLAMVSTIYAGSENDDGTKVFFKKLADAGGGEFEENRGKILESILLAVIRKPLDE